MTCIVGYVKDGIVTMGGDSAGAVGYFSVQRADEKVFLNGECLFGITSSFRMGNLLRYKFSPPNRQENASDDEYIYTTFIDAVIECLRSNGYAKIKENELQGGCFLLGYRGNLYSIEEDFQIAKIPLPFYAIGCGADFALGSLHSLHCGSFSPDVAGVIKLLTPEVKITMALEAAAKFSGWVRHPFVFEKIGRAA